MLGHLAHLSIELLCHTAVFLTILYLHVYLHSKERKVEVAAAVQEKLLEAICGVSDDENMKKSMLELLLAGIVQKSTLVETTCFGIQMMAMNRSYNFRRIHTGIMIKTKFYRYSD